jgi:hypothetical protein
VNHPRVARGSPAHTGGDSAFHLEHGAVHSQHVAGQLRYPGCSPERRESLDQQGADASALPLVVDQNRELRSSDLYPLVGRHADDQPSVLGDDDSVVRPRRTREPPDLPFRVGGPGEEPEVPAMSRYPPMQVKQRFGVSRSGRAKEDDGSV